MLIINRFLLAHAEVFKDVSEDFVGSDLTEDLAEVGEALAEVFGYEVTGEVVTKGIEGALDVGVGLGEGFEVAEVGDEEVVVVVGDGSDKLVFEVLEADVVEGLELVGLVDDSDDGLVLSDGHVGIGDAGFGNEEDDLCFFSGFDAAFDAHLLDGVGGSADACCVDEAEGDVVKSDSVFDDVAGGALDVADDSTVVTQECVEQGTLAYVGSPDDGDGYAVLDSVAELEGVGELADFLMDVFGQLDEFLTVGKFDVFFGEVEFQLEQRGHLEELVA